MKISNICVLYMRVFIRVFYKVEIMDFLVLLLCIKNCGVIYIMFINDDSNMCDSTLKTHYTRISFKWDLISEYTSGP